MTEHTWAIDRAVSVFSNTIDHSGLCREDYASELKAHLWKLYEGDFVHVELVDTVLRNKVRDFQRKRRKKLSEWIPVESEYKDCEQFIISRELVHALKVVLPKNDWAMLELYVENDFRIKDVWRKCSQKVVYEVFVRKFHRLLQYCKEYIQSICNFRPGGRVIN